MRINPISTYNYNFKGLHSMKPDTPKELFGNKAPVFDELSDAKKLDIWAFDGVFNRKAGYHVIVRRSVNGELLKEMNCNNTKEEKETLNNRLKETLVWIDAPCNLPVIGEILQGRAAKENPKFTALVAKEMQSATMGTHEAKIWQAKLPMI